MPPEPDPDPPASVSAGVARFADFDDLAAFYTGWQVGVEQYTAGRFAGTVGLARTPTLYAVEGQFSQALTVRGTSNPAECAFYLIEPESADSVWWGRRLNPGRLVAVGRGTAADYRSGRNTRTVGVAVPTEVLAWATGAVLGSDPPAETGGWAALEPAPQEGASLARRLRQLMAFGLTDPAGLAGPDGHRLEQECLRALVEATQPSGIRPRADLPLSSRSALVGRAEELMRSRLREAVGAIDLCAELGVSDRTLRQAFQERYGMGPMVYFKTLRLNAVRAALKTAAPGMVAATARFWGFHHLGNFAYEYRRAFGERPSQTVRVRSRTVERVG